MSRRRIGLWLLAALVAASILALALLPPIAQPAGYHRFADRRQILGIPNFWNVVSNLPFLLVGLAGVRELLLRKPQGVLGELRPAWLVFFLGAAGVALGSAWYHLAPTDASLTWDRLPMTVCLTSLLVILLGEHLEPRQARHLLPPLLVLGLASVVYWRLTGDLRLYVLVQFLPLLLIALLLLLFPSRLTKVHLMWLLLLAYGVAKGLEAADAWVFSLGGWVSGHTLKHLAAAAGMYALLWALRLRRPI